MNDFYKNLTQKLGAENFAKVQKAKIGIAGAGGLGSNCAQCLIRSGFRNLVIVDFDSVSVSNLDRQFYFSDQAGKIKTEALRENLLRINSDLNLIMLNRKIESKLAADIFSDCDIVAECLDQAEYKRMLVEDLLFAGKFVVAVSGLGGIGSSDEIRVQSKGSRLVLIGDGISDIARFPALSPRVTIAAAKQADEILFRIIGSSV